MKNKSILLSLFIFMVHSLTGAFIESPKLSWVEQNMRDIAAKAPDLDQRVLRLALSSYKEAIDQGVSQSPILSVVDFSKLSGERRLWVIDVERDEILFHEWVAHGRNSGDRAIASQFSNKAGSLKSSLGLFKTGYTYKGKNFGLSLKLHGLQPGINDNALMRGIVVHGARYVSEALQDGGTIGRSLGCLAVRPSVSQALIHTIKDGTLVYAYHPSLMA